MFWHDALGKIGDLGKKNENLLTIIWPKSKKANSRNLLGRVGRQSTNYTNNKKLSN